MEVAQKERKRSDKKESLRQTATTALGRQPADITASFGWSIIVSPAHQPRAGNTIVLTCSATLPASDIPAGRILRSGPGRFGICYGADVVQCFQQPRLYNLELCDAIQ